MAVKSQQEGENRRQGVVGGQEVEKVELPQWNLFSETIIWVSVGKPDLWVRRTESFLGFNQRTLLCFYASVRKGKVLKR